MAKIAYIKLVPMSASEVASMKADRGRRGNRRLYAHNDAHGPLFLYRIVRAEELRREKVAEYASRFASPYAAASLGYVDNVIEPVEIRRELIKAIEMLATKRGVRAPRRHGNIPL